MLMDFEEVGWTGSAKDALADCCEQNNVSLCSIK